jgi:hypothetical protein
MVAVDSAELEKQDNTIARKPAIAKRAAKKNISYFIRLPLL